MRIYTHDTPFRHITTHHIHYISHFFSINIFFLKTIKIINTENCNALKWLKITRKFLHEKLSYNIDEMKQYFNSFRGTCTEYETRQSYVFLFFFLLYTNRRKYSVCLWKKKLFFFILNQYTTAVYMESYIIMVCINIMIKCITV